MTDPAALPSSRAPLRPVPPTAAPHRAAPIAALLAALLAALFVAATPAVAEVLHPLEAQRMHEAEGFRAVDELAYSLVDDDTLPSVAFAVARDGEILHEGAFGLADRERGVRATTRTPYALASATKPITATALVRLLGDAPGALDVPVAQALPGLRLGGAPAGAPTLAQLLTHTGGLGTYARIRYGDDIANTPSVVDTAARFGVLVNPPGRIAEYSNLGYGLLGEVVAARHGTPFGTALRDLVFAPLGMDDAYVDVPGPDQNAPAVHYDASLSPLPPLRNDTPGAGNVYASVHDMIRFASMHAGRCTDTPLGCAQVERMRERHGDAWHHYYGDAHYGFGWYVRDDAGHPSAWHEGGMPGASTLVQVLPDQHVAVVVMTNRSDANDKVQAIAAALMRAAVMQFEPEPFDPTEGYELASISRARPNFFGVWTGPLVVGDHALDCRLDISPAGQHLRCTEGEKAWIDGGFGGVIRKGERLRSFVSALPGQLPVPELAGKEPLLLVKLVREGEEMRGAIVAYVDQSRLEYLLPFPIVLRREPPSS